MKKRAVRERQNSDYLMTVGIEENDSTLSKLEADLEIDQTALAKEMAKQPELFYRSSIVASRLAAQLDFTERQKILTEIRVASDIRRGSEDRDVKLTSEEIDARTVTHGDVDKLVVKCGDLRRRFLLAEALRSAYAQRLTALETLMCYEK